MKKTILLTLSLGLSYAYCQDLYSINNGAVSSNNLIYTVGEIFVLPVSDPNEASSGTIGAVSRIEFFVTGLNELTILENVTAYPNPTSNSVFIETENEKFNAISIYDLSGRLVENKNVINNQVDLSSLQTGTYLIQTNNQKIQSFKIIKK
ncbi:MAG: T9SS type A sorting domain-containing protein [Chitinophagales bacterium]|nr:T9SS type A sorting domain-containing protein [Chitinophagales bacterium]